MKGITPVIAVILLLLITIAIIGFTSVFFQQTVTTGGEQAQQAAAGQANKALQTAEIVDVSNGKVTIKNVGTEPISTANVQIFVDGDPAATTPVGDAENIQPGSTKTFDIAVPPGTGERKITVAVPGNVMEKTFQLDAGTADLISAEGNVITLKNSGVTSIQDSEISMKVDGAGVTFTGPASLAAGAEGVYTITPSSIPAGSGTRALEITTPQSVHTADADINIGTISLEGITGNKLSIKNTGLTTIAKDELILTVAGQGVTFTGAAQIGPDASEVYAVNEIEILGREGTGGALSLQSPASTITDNTAFDYDLTTKGYWKFDDLDQGTAIKDSSGNGMDGTFVGTTHDGTLGGGATIITQNRNGQDSKILALDGSGDYLTVGDDILQGKSAVTFSVWFKAVSQSNAYARLFNYGWHTNAFMFVYTSGNTLSFWTSDASNSQKSASVSLAPDGEWHHAAGVWQSGSIHRLYLDGALVGSDSLPSAFVPKASVLYMGGSGGSNSYVGALDEARIYGRALTADEVATDMNSKYPLSGVMASYSFESMRSGKTVDTHFIVRGKNDAPSDPDGALQLKGGSDYVLINDNAGLRGMGELTMSALVNPLAMAPGYNGRIISTSSPGNYDWNLQTANQK